MLLQAKTEEPSKESDRDATRGSGNDSSDEGEPAPPGEEGDVNLENHDKSHEFEKNEGTFTKLMSVKTVFITWPDSFSN